MSFKPFWPSLLVVLLGAGVVALALARQRNDSHDPSPRGPTTPAVPPALRSEKSDEEMRVEMFWGQRRAFDRFSKSNFRRLHEDLVTSLELTPEQAERLKTLLEEERVWFMDLGYPLATQEIDQDFLNSFFGQRSEPEKREAVMEPRLKAAIGDRAFERYLDWKKMKGRRWFFYTKTGYTRDYDDK